MSDVKMTQSGSMSRRYFVFLIGFLGMLSAFGPFVTDMYLPTLPSLARVFATTPSMVQMGLTTSMLGLAIGQLFFGPLSDKYGRKSILYWSLALFVVSTAISIFSPTIEFFTVMRLFQGVGAAGGLVMSRAVATDAYSGKELAKTMAIIGAVNGIAPVTAPVIGGLVSAAVGWQGIFVILLGIGIVLTLMCTRFRESLPMERRNKSGLRSVYAAFFTVLRVRRYVLYLLSFGFANGVLFGYIASAPFVVQTHYGLSELGFSIFFALNSIFIGIGTGISLKFKNITNAGLCGAIGMVVFAVVQYVAFLTVDSFYCYVPAMSLTLLSMGILFTSTTSMAMDAGRVSVGAASAIFGALGFFMGGVVSPVVGIGNLMHSMSITLIASAALSLCCMVLARCIKSVE